NEHEQQVISFAGLGAGEQFTLSCAGCPTSDPVTFGANPADAAALTTQLQAVTGQVPVVSGYDGAAAADADGFTAAWNASTAGIPTLTVNPVASPFTSSTGTT